MILQHYKIRAPIERVWAALVTPGLIKQWSGAPAKMSAAEKADFELWSGDIWGTNTLVKAPRHLEQDWYGGKWKKPSKVCFALVEENGVTEVTLCHSLIPENEKDFADGWRDYYMDPIKKLLEAD